MKAVRIHAYGSLDEMKYEDAPVPTPGAGQVLVRVADAGVNPVEAKIISGAMKDIMPVTFPYTPGSDLAGTVEAVGTGVMDFARSVRLRSGSGKLRSIRARAGRNPGRAATVVVLRGGGLGASGGDDRLGGAI